MSFLLLVALVLPARAEELTAVVSGRPAQLVYEAFLAKEIDSAVPGLRETRSYKSDGGLSCFAACSWDTTSCSFECTLKRAPEGHALLWNNLRAPIREGKRGGVTEYYKEIGALSCTARLLPKEALFDCVFK